MTTACRAAARVGRARAAILLAIAFLGGCAVVGPDYKAPALPQPPVWRATLPHDGSTERLTDWWSRFDDPAVTRLIQWAEIESPTLATAAANIDSARATQVTARAGGLPSVTGSASADRARTAVGDTGQLSTTRSVGLDASWEIDLFGKVRRTREAADARYTARVADWHDARVSLAAEAADDYVVYRGCRLIEAAYADEATSQQETLRLTRILVTSGFSAQADLELAEASYASAQSTLISQRATCESEVKALVALTGVDEPVLRPVIDAAQGLPRPAMFEVAGVPADLLRQRPDVASDERALAAASAEIGEAEAARYPSLSISGSIAVGPTSPYSSVTSWSIGPSLSLPLFDGGSLRAAVTTARAAYDVAYATYRSAVRTAVREVEQALVTLDGAATQAVSARTASESYRRYVGSTETYWRNGGATLLTLEEARRSAISAQVTLIGLERDQVRDWITLYKVLGGGWTVDTNTEVAAAASPSKGNSP